MTESEANSLKSLINNLITQAEVIKVLIDSLTQQNTLPSAMVSLSFPNVNHVFCVASGQQTQQRWSITKPDGTTDWLNEGLNWWPDITIGTMGYPDGVYIVSVDIGSGQIGSASFTRLNGIDS